MGEAAGYLKQLRLEARPILTLMILMTLISPSSMRDVCGIVHVVLSDLTMKTLRILMTHESLSQVQDVLLYCSGCTILYDLTLNTLRILITLMSLNTFPARPIARVSCEQ